MSELTPQPTEDLPPIESVQLSVETADAVIEQLLAVIDMNEEEHLNHVLNLESLLKTIILSAGGSVSIPKDLFQVIIDGNYKTIISEADDKMTLILAENTDEVEME